MLDHGCAGTTPRSTALRPTRRSSPASTSITTGVELVGADPVTLRSTAGRLGSPISEVMGTASEHDRVAGTERCAHTLFVFNLAGRRDAHVGDLTPLVIVPVAP